LWSPPERASDKYVDVVPKLIQAGELAPDTPPDFGSVVERTNAAAQNELAALVRPARPNVLGRSRDRGLLGGEGMSSRRALTPKQLKRIEVIKETALEICCELNLLPIRDQMLARKYLDVRKK
jgi:hypothetical protein